MSGRSMHVNVPPAFNALYEYYRTAVELAPDDAVYRNDLAVILSVRGDYHEALAQIERAIELRPGLTVAYVNGALFAAALRGCEAGLPWIDAALRTEPDHVAAILLRARVLAKLCRADEAVALSRRAIALKPGDAQGYETLGLALHAQGKHDEAVEALTQAQSCAPNGTIGARKAILLLQQGRRAEALSELRAVLEREPNLAFALFVQAFAREFVLDDREIERMEHLVTSGVTLTFNDRMWLEFAIGNAHLANASAPAAFTHLAIGNGMKRSSVHYDVGDDERYAGEQIARYSKDVFERAEGKGAASNVPIFVLGMPRSGTSLVEQILASHPAVFGAGEVNYIAALAGDGLVPEFERLRELGSSYLRDLGGLASGAERIVDKMPLNFFHAGFIHLILPQALIVHCRRDAMDTCLSCYATLFDEHLEFSYDLGDLGRFYRVYERLMMHWRSVLPPGRLIEFDYEAFVNDFEGEVRRLIAACGLPWDDRCLAFHKTQRPVRTASVNQVRRPIYRSSLGRGKQHEAYLKDLVDALKG